MWKYDITIKVSVGFPLIIFIARPVIAMFRQALHLAHHGQSSAFIHRRLAEGHQFLWRCCPKVTGA